MNDYLPGSIQCWDRCGTWNPLHASKDSDGELYIAHPTVAFGPLDANRPDRTETYILGCGHLAISEKVR
jgi:hypothetical protein